MATFVFNAQNVKVIDGTAPPATPADFVWIDALRSEVIADPAAWAQQIFGRTQIHIDDFHLTDILNAQHPSYFDLTHDYEFLIFRKLLARDETTVTLDPAALSTEPVIFIITKTALITVRDAASTTFDVLQQRLLQKTESPRSGRLPSSTLDLTLRILNALVDKYLALRSPLTRRVELWQNLLLQGNHRFNNWSQLLNERLALHQLDSLCEEQLDALQELRDEYLEQQTATNDVEQAAQPRRDMMMVRIHDLIEHVNRVQNHAARLEESLKSAVELHFSSNAHQTNENMRFLAILSSIFAPMTLLTGIYGMNFDVIPGLHNQNGFWWLLGAMVGTTCGLLYYFRYRRLVGRGNQSVTDLLGSSTVKK